MNRLVKEFCYARSLSTMNTSSLVTERPCRVFNFEFILSLVMPSFSTAVALMQFVITSFVMPVNGAMSIAVLTSEI